MVRKYVRHFVCMFLALLGMSQSAAAFTDIKVDLMNGNLLTAEELVQWQQLPDIGIAVAEDGTVTRVAADDAKAVAILSGKWHSNEHGWAGFKATVPVEGPVKITMGTCAWGGDVTINDANGTTVGTFNTNTGACYHADKTANIVSAFYKGEATTLTIAGGNYTPYFAVEAVSPEDIPNDAKITFSLGDVKAEGEVPAEATVEYGSKFIIPQNRTLYAEGKTLTAWTDGAQLYVPGEEYTIKDNLTLTPVFTENSVSFADRTAEITAIWDFQKKNGAPLLNHQKDKGVYVTQVTVKGKTIDLKLDFDTTNGKIANGNWQDWCQMNSGTILTIPAFKGATISLESYSATTTTTIAGSTDYTTDGNVVTYNYTGEAETLDIVIGDGSYYRYVKAVYPAAKEAEPAKWQDISVSLVGSLLKSSERVEGTALEFGVAIAEDGTQTRVEANDPSANCILKGVWHDDAHGWTKAQMIVKVNGPVTIGVGNCQYGNQDASYVDAEGNKVDFQTAKNCWNSKDIANTTTYIRYNGGATTLTVNGASYTPYFSIAAVKTTWDAETAVATFPFDKGTEDQKADFGEQAEAFLSSKIIHGATLFINGTQTHGGITETTFKSNISNEAEPNADNAIKFMIRPYPGLVFTPTKVSFNASRYGTDSGSLDIAWQNADGSTISLATNEKMNRNNASAPSDFSYVITNATPGEGECGLLLNLYNVFENKEMGFGNIVIEGTLKGTKQEIPVLATITANGITYDVEKTFEVQGDNYVANIELFSTDKMVSQENPVTVEVKAGELGTITYEGDDQKTVVTIPVTHNNISMNWVANFVRKPMYTLTFFDADNKTVLGTQVVEKDVAVEAFAVGADKVTVSEGYKFRGWTIQPAGLNTVKSKEGSSFQSDTNLYPYISVIEVATPTARFDYDLTNPNFDFDDHEMISIEGNGFWHDKQHGWAFYQGDKINLELGGKGYIKMNLCLYSGEGDLKLVAADGTVIGSVANKAEADGATATIQYDGSKGAGIFTLEIPAVSYIHSISIRNQEEDPFTHVEGTNIYMVKQGKTPAENGSNLLSMLEQVNGIQGTDRVVVFMQDGTYDLGETVLTAISRSNVSLIGQSMDGTIIKNAPDISIEGIGTTATLVNTSSNFYMQDLTLQNALDYYGAVRQGMPGGRAVAFWDKGKNTVSKNVKLLSYQDTYYSNSNSQFYWETSEIHGTVDYLCGGGDVYYNEVTFVNESRSADAKSGTDVIAAPYTDASCKFGYVMNNCIVENKAQKFSFGRSWGGTARLTFINTTLNQPDEIVDTRFNLGGMNVAAQNFHEYKSKDKDGNIVSPASLVETFTKDDISYTYDIILSDEQAAEFTLDKVFPNWTPNEIAKQAAAPTNVKLNSTTLTWDANDAQLWAIIKDGQVVSFTASNSYTIDDASAGYGIRAANAMGGLSEMAEVPTYAAVTLSKQGYATFFDSKKSYQIPENIKASVVTEGTADKLTYAEILDIIPAGTAVMLQSANKTGGEITLTSTSKKAAYEGTNLLKGSDEATTTTADETSWFYKLTYGAKNSKYAGTFGWFWGAADGAAFQIEGHRAWLAIPQVGIASPAFTYSLESNATGISTISGTNTADGQYYNLKGQRVATPTKGLYIHNNKKIVIK